MVPVRQERQPSMADFAHVQHPLLQLLLAYYLDLRQGRPVPRRSQVSPLDIPQLLSHVFLYEFDRTSQDFRIRLAGSVVAEKVATARSGARLSDVFPPAVFPVVLQRYRRVCVERLVMHNIGRIFHLLGGTGTGERIVMPLQGDDDRTDFLIGATVYTLAEQEAPRTTGAEPVAITYTPLVPQDN